MEPEEIARRLGVIFGSICSDSYDWNKKTTLYSIARPGDISFLQLMKACEVLGCTPEELFCTADEESEGYCDTCHYSYPVLNLWVVRKGA